MFEAIALVALDLDRTLFRSDMTISGRTLGAIAACRDRGIQVAIATARSFASVKRFLPEVLHRDVPWVCGSGGSVYENYLCLHRDLIPYKTARGIVEVLYGEAPDYVVTLEMNGQLYINRPLEGVVTPHQVCDLRTVVNGPVTKFLVNALDDPFSRKVPLAQIQPADQISLPALPAGCKIQWTDQGTRANILSPTVSKVHGLEVVLDKRGLRFDQVMAFGDDISDRDMLVKSAIGVAMGNGVAEVLAVADRVTASNDEDGVAVVLEALAGKG